MTSYCYFSWHHTMSHNDFTNSLQTKAWELHFWSHDLDLWPMTLIIKLVEDFIKVNPPTNFQVCLSNSSAARALTDTETDNTALYTINKKLITNMQTHLVHQLIGTSYVVHYQSVRRYKTIFWTLICIFVVKHTILCPYAPHPYVRTKSVHFFTCSLWITKKWKMSGLTPTSHGHSPPLVHHGAQRRLVVHNVVLYPWGGAQRWHDIALTNAHTQTERRKGSSDSITSIVIRHILSFPGIANNLSWSIAMILLAFEVLLKYYS